MTDDNKDGGIIPSIKFILSVQKLKVIYGMKNTCELSHFRQKKVILRIRFPYEENRPYNLFKNGMEKSRKISF